jgi:NAD(P)-dependent dehydrogenase (short-subunit alcohol dehydrogenase family)
MSGDLTGKGILITGAFGVLGSATALAALERGARVALMDQAARPPAGLVDHLGPDAVVIPGVDLVVTEQAEKAVEAAAQRLGRLDVLLNIAGAFRWQTVADGNPATWDLLFAINLKTALNGSRAALPYLRKSEHGRIINVGANAATRAGAGMGPYAASKAAVHRLTESLAEELKSAGKITVNAVLPSIIDTPANRAEMPTADFSTWVTPRALADIILFLASPQSQAITGALVPVIGRV